MQFKRASLKTCGDATDTVVVIDVIRAFSTAAYAFAAGVKTIALVSTVNDAIALKKQTPGAYIMGEVDGLPVSAFDFSNSPSAFDGHDLANGFLIQRTSAGTQGIIGSKQAEHLYASSFCCADATARCIRKQSPEMVTFVVTGDFGGGHGDEDVACADYIEALLCGEKPEIGPFIQRVRDSHAGRLFADPARPEFPETDLGYCLNVDRFDFAMRVYRRNGLLLMETIK